MLSEKTGAALQQIIVSVKETAGMIDGIATSTSQQTASAQEAASAVEQISTVAESNAAGSEEMAASSEELGAQAENLGRLVSRFQTTSSHSSRPSDGKQKVGLVGAKKPNPRNGQKLSGAASTT
jgi:hypothetical protein